jgi:hypothetical protein
MDVSVVNSVIDARRGRETVGNGEGSRTLPSLARSGNRPFPTFATADAEPHVCLCLRVWPGTVD